MFARGQPLPLSGCFGARCARDPRRQAGSRRDRGTRWRGMGADGSRPRTAVRSRGRLWFYSGLRGPANEPRCIGLRSC